MERSSTGKFAGIIVFILILGGASSAFAIGAVEGARVLVNGQIVTFNHSPQTLQVQGTLLAPIAPIAAMMGATTQWHPETRTIQVDYGNIIVAMAIDNNEMTVINRSTRTERPVILHVPPRTINGVEYYPVDIIARELGATVTHEVATNTYNITTPGSVQPPPQVTAQGSSPGAAGTGTPRTETTPTPPTRDTTTPGRTATPAPAPTRNYRLEAARRNVLSPSVFSLIGFSDEWWMGTLISLGTSRLAGTNLDGKFGLNMELFNIDYSPIQYLSFGLGAGGGITFKDGVQVNWFGVKPYIGFTVPIWVAGNTYSSYGEGLRIYGDGFFEIGYSTWGNLLTGSTEPGFGFNPGFELGLQFGEGNYWISGNASYHLEASYAITFYSGSHLKHAIGLTVRFYPDWW